MLGLMFYFECLPITEMCNEANDLVFVIDCSASIEFAQAGNWDRLLKFVNDIVAKRIIGKDSTRVGVVQFSTDVVSSLYLNQYYNKVELMDAISNIRFKGRSTFTAGGIREMRTVQFTAGHGDRPGVHNIAIVITDGVSIIEPEKTVPEAQKAQQQGIDVYSIGITDKVDVNEVRDISSPPHELNKNYFLVTDFSNLDVIVQATFDATCDDVVQTTTTTTPPPAGECTLQVFLAVQRNIGTLERIQWRTNKMILELRERLKECGLTTLETRRLRGDQTKCLRY